MGSAPAGAAGRLYHAAVLLAVGRLDEARGPLAGVAANQAAPALEIFTAVAALRDPDGDGPSRFFIERLQAGEAMEDGVVTLREQ